MSQIVENDKKSDQYIKWFELYDEFFRKFFRINRLRWPYLDRIGRCFDLICVNNSYDMILRKENQKIGLYQVVHKFPFFNDMELIALDGDELFKCTFDFIVDEKLNGMIGVIFPGFVYNVEFEILHPEHRSINFLFTKHDYDFSIVRKMLLEANLLFNLLTTDFIKIFLTVIKIS